VSWLITTIIVLGAHYYLAFTSLRFFGVILGASVLSLFGVIIVRYWERLASGLASRLVTRRLHTQSVRERVLIVGSGRTAEHISWLMDHPTYSEKFHIVGFIDDDLQLQGMNIYGSKVIGRVEHIQKIVQERDIGLIILADNQMALRKYSQFRNTSSFSPARIVVVPDIFGSLNGLNGRVKNSETVDNLNDFECQHCVARYATYQPFGFKETTTKATLSGVEGRE
jgi:FlaA1/EpsC-like NDP-sugar epimerase